MVLAVIAMASAGVGFALRAQGQTQLDREGLRLVALLEAARAQSRTSGLRVVWHGQAEGFVFSGLPAPLPGAPSAGGSMALPDRLAVTPWLADGVAVAQGATVVLGPEPIIGRQQIVLALEGRSLLIATDGLRPFAVREEPAPAGDVP